VSLSAYSWCHVQEENRFPQVAVLGSPAYAVTSEIAAEGEIVNATPLGSESALYGVYLVGG